MKMQAKSIEELELLVETEIGACVAIERDSLKAFDLGRREYLGRVNADNSGYSIEFEPSR